MAIEMKFISENYTKKFCFINYFNAYERAAVKINFRIGTAKNNFCDFCHINGYILAAAHFKIAQNSS